MLYAMEYKLTCFLLLAVSLLSVKADLQVQIVKEGVNIYRNINESLTLNCTATTNGGGPLESIYWKKDRKDINSTLSSNNWAVKTITSISRSDAGYYKCAAKYKDRVEDDAVFVNVKGKPMIFKSGEPELFTRSPQWPQDGDPVLDLRCHATGSKIITYIWLKDGKEIKQMNGFSFLPAINNGKTLRLSPVGKDKQGKYTCEASNKYGKDSHNITVRVLDRFEHPVITAEKSIISSYIGEANIFVCNGKNVIELEADAAWLFNGKEITKEQIENSSRLHAEVNYEGSSKTMRMSLLINQTSLQDAGNYTCRVFINDETSEQTTLLVIKRREKRQSGDTKETILTTKELAGLIVGVILLITAILIVILYLTKKKTKINYPEIPKGPFKYGAFVTYNSQDFNWVEKNLLPLLEKNGIDLCIHYRNFEPGVAIHENMVNSVYRSRVVIVVMSNNYMKSKYCRAELDYAVHRSLEEHGTNPLIILCIDPDIKKNRLPKEIKNKTFLDFTSNVEKATWEKRLLKYIKWSDENENAREDKEEEECAVLIKH
ncbi:fibroblast growth factor receptor 3-like [Actinia tenebrosa]|nr:fibroblast growth factor receptor 3-like [Actinia tenebrosa]